MILFSFYRIHDVFHVFYLKSYKKRKNDNMISKYFSSEFFDDDEVNEIKKILQKKISKRIIYYLIKWKDWLKKYNEWIIKKNMNAFNLFQEFDERTKKNEKSNKNLLLFSKKKHTHYLILSYHKTKSIKILNDDDV